MRVGKNIAWAVAGKIATLLGGLIIGILVARYLGASQYGLMNYVISFVAIFQVFADFGLDLIQIREEAANKANYNRIIGTTFGLKCIFAIVTLIAIFITTHMLEADLETRIYIWIYAFSVLFNTTWVVRNHFTSIVWNEYVVKSEIVRTTIGIGIKVLFVLLRLPLIWFILSLVLDSILLASGYMLSYHRKIGRVHDWHFDGQLARYMLLQSFPLLLSGAAIVVYNRIDQLMIGNMIDNRHLGIYSVAVKFVEILTFVPTILSQTISPILVEKRAISEEQYQRVAALFMNISVWGCVLLAILTSLIAYPIIRLSFGLEYIEASSILAILSFRIIGDALSQTSGQMIIIEQKQRFVFIRNIIGCIVCITLNLLLIPRFGITAVAIVAIITIISSGTISNLLIPQYRAIFKHQIRALLIGWKDIKNIKELLNA